MKGEIDNQSSLLRWQGSQRRIGITGGIASGKSSVGEYLKEIKGLPILDADVFAHEALAPGAKATMTVIERYGNTVQNKTTCLTPTINRSKLSKIIFSNPKERLWIEKVIHPLVRQRLKKELTANKNAPVIALIIPLLFEAKLTQLCSEIWVVNCSQAQQCKRLMKRDGLTDYEAKARVKAQWPLQDKLRLADVVIDNNRGLQAWLKDVDKLC